MYARLRVGQNVVEHAGRNAHAGLVVHVVDHLKKARYALARRRRDEEDRRIVPTTSRTAYVKDNQDTRRLAESIKCDTFYRVEKGDSKTKNDGAWMNFPSASLFSSVANASLTDI